MPKADITLAGFASLLVSCFNGVRRCGGKLLCQIHSSQPKTVQVGKVVTGAPRSLALNEGVSSEILEAATGGSQ